MIFIVDNIYLGNSEDAKNIESLKSHNITHILIPAIGIEKHFTDIEYLSFPIYDSPYTNISKYFDECIDFIKTSKGNVLVHCAMGISRSATIVIAYLIIEKKMSYTEAYLYLKNKRNIINPNEGFQKQLIKLSYEIVKKG